MHCSNFNRLFDHLVGTCQRRGRDRESKRFGGPEIDRQLILGGGLHREIARLIALKDSIHVSSRSPMLRNEIGTIREQASIERAILC